MPTKEDRATGSRPGEWGNEAPDERVDSRYDAAREPGEDISWQLTEAQIRGIRPPLPQVTLFPPRYGYFRTAPTIYDVIDVNSRYRQEDMDDYSGTLAQHSGETRNVAYGGNPSDWG